MLSSAFPAMVCWGDECIQIYNDSFRQVIGVAKHPGAMGTSAFDPDHQNPVISVKDIERAMIGENASVSDVIVGSGTPGHQESRYFDCIYNPIKDELGVVRGVLVVCAETTQRILAVNELQAYKDNIRLVIRQSPVGICIVNADTGMITEVNDTFLQIVGNSRDNLLLDPASVFKSDTLNWFPQSIATVIDTGREYRTTEQKFTSITDGLIQEIYADFVFEPVHDDQGRVIAVVVIANDITDKIQAKLSLQNMNEELATTTEEIAASNEELSATNEDLIQTQEALQQSLKRLTESEQQIRAIIENAPFPIAVYLGRSMQIIQANQAVIDVWGKGADVIGKTYYELLPELEAQNVYEHLDKVFTTGVAYNAKNERVILNVDGVANEFYFNYSFTPLRNSSGTVYGVVNTAADVTELNIAKFKVEQSERNFKNIIRQAPVAMCLLSGPEHVVEVVNGAMLDIWGKPLSSVLKKPVFEALSDAREQGLEQVITGVFRSGEIFRASEQPVRLIRHGKKEVVYQNFAYHPYHNADGEIVGVLAISVNVTEQVMARFELEHAYEQARLSKEAAELGTFDMDMVGGSLQWDERCRELFGISHRNPVTYEQDFLTGLHPDDRQRVVEAIAATMDRGVSEGDYDVEYRTVGAADQRIRWVRAKGKAYFDKEGAAQRFIGSVLDITEQKLNEIRLRDLAEKQGRLAAIVDTSDDAIISKTLEGKITSWNKAAQDLFGYEQHEAIGRHISLIIPKERLSEEDYIISRIKAGKKVDHFQTIRIDRDGNPKHLSISISPILDEGGQIIGASKIARDISGQIASQEAINRYTSHLEVLNSIIGAVSEELDLDKVLQKVTDATTELTGAQFGAFFYNKEDENGDSYMLFTLSGAPREAFEQLGMPRNTAVFHPIFSGQGVMRVDDITKDPRYGQNLPHHGMPKGHLPVVSYLAVPVVSRSGKVIGGLFFGHPDAGVFTQDHESLVISIAAQAAIGIDNAKLYEEVKALNDKKDEFIGLASHELKTPLTSVSGYLQIISRLDDKEQITKFLAKAALQVQKLTTLVNDLLDVSKIEAGKLKLTLAEFDLVETINESIELVKQGASRYTISFNTEHQQCLLTGDSQRIEQVLLNLLNNAVKYSPGADRIEVSLHCVDKYARVGIRDFGLGIPQDKLLSIFSRFYRIDEATPNISGLGIGLYLSHEIISRHDGKIWVESKEGKGSTFWFELPK